MAGSVTSEDMQNLGRRDALRLQPAHTIDDPARVLRIEIVGDYLAGRVVFDALDDLAAIVECLIARRVEIVRLEDLDLQRDAEIAAPTDMAPYQDLTAIDYRPKRKLLKACKVMPAFEIAISSFRPGLPCSVNRCANIIVFVHRLSDDARPDRIRDDGPYGTLGIGVVADKVSVTVS